mmetsp:Transcript_30009/g.36945  ORF Transcript_30009/g.36945 Transcript_30009/m.36945 type:complete len:542 (-) Transcript_30009:1893-3518(-)
MKAIWNTLQLNSSRWRQIFKALTLLEFLIKNGAEKCVDEARERIYQVKSLTGFSYYHEGNEKGTGIRELSKKILELLNDNEQIREERDKAKANRDKYKGIGKDGISNGGFSGGAYDDFVGSGSGSGGGFGRSGSVSGGGRYDDSKPFEKYSDKKWDDGIAKKEQKKKKKKNYDDSDEEDSDDEKRRHRSISKSKSKKKHYSDEEDDDGHEDPFDSMEKHERKGKKDKKGKGAKLKVKIKTSKVKKKALEDEDLFGDLQGGAEPDLLGNSSPSNGGTFDPFGDSNGDAAQNNDEWSAFESGQGQAATRNSNSESDDLFGSFSSAIPSNVQQPQTQHPSQSADGFGDFASFSPPRNHQNMQQNAAPEMDLFGSLNNGGQTTNSQGRQELDLFGGMTSGGAPVQIQAQPQFQQMQAPMMSAMSMPMQQQGQLPKPATMSMSMQIQKDDTFGGLVDLANLSLNSKPAAATSNDFTPLKQRTHMSPGMSTIPPMQHQPMGGVGQMQQTMGMGGMQQPMGGMQQMQSMMQPMMVNNNFKNTNMQNKQ